MEKLDEGMRESRLLKPDQSKSDLCGETSGAKTGYSALLHFYAKRSTPSAIKSTTAEVQNLRSTRIY